MKIAAIRPMKKVPLSALSRRSQSTESVLVTARSFTARRAPAWRVSSKARGITEAQIERHIQALGTNRGRR